MTGTVAGTIDEVVAATSGEVVALRRDMHARPELSNREVRTAGVVAEHLRRLDLDEVRTGIAGHGVVGLLRGGRPGERVVALRADMDALPVTEASGEPFASTVPGVAHACGHDCHVATVLGAATALAAVRDDLPGAVLFVFQPAEEGPPVDEDGGARLMLAEGALSDPEPTMVFGMHVSPLPAGIVGYRSGIQYAASCLVRVVVVGRQTHGAMPWAGADPMPAVAAIVTGAAQLHRQVPATDPMAVTFGHVEDVGRFNVIGERVTLWGTIRSLGAGGMQALQAHLRSLAEHTALAHGCTAQVDFLQDVPPVDNRAAWLDAALPTIRRVVGDDRVVEVPPALVYDDVSEMVAAFGGLYLSYGVQDAARGFVPNHHPGFYAVEHALPDSVRIHAHVAVDHLRGELAVLG